MHNGDDGEHNPLTGTKPLSLSHVIKQGHSPCRAFCLGRSSLAVFRMQLGLKTGLEKNIVLSLAQSTTYGFCWLIANVGLLPIYWECHKALFFFKKDLVLVFLAFIEVGQDGDKK